jgi:hypothetical protein
VPSAPTADQSAVEESGAIATALSSCRNRRFAVEPQVMIMFRTTPLARSAPLMVIASVSMLAFSQAGCDLLDRSAPKQKMAASAENTSGEGTVQAKSADNGNTQVEVRVKHLSSPSKVAADASVYVVWIQPRDAAIQNAGALQVNDELVGKFVTITPHRAFTLTVTPEPSARMAAPTHQAVLTSEVKRE